jgi:hypothetical protein
LVVDQNFLEFRAGRDFQVDDAFSVILNAIRNFMDALPVAVQAGVKLTVPNSRQTVRRRVRPLYRQPPFERGLVTKDATYGGVAARRRNLGRNGFQPSLHDLDRNGVR